MKSKIVWIELIMCNWSGIDKLVPVKFRELMISQPLREIKIEKKPLHKNVEKLNTVKALIFTSHNFCENENIGDFASWKFWEFYMNRTGS